MEHTTNVDRHELSVDKNALQKLNGHKSKVFWFTGLSGAGKSTVANALARELYNIGRRSYVLDGDNLRLGISADLGFSEQDPIENYFSWIFLNCSSLYREYN